LAIIKDIDMEGKRVIMEDASDIGSITDIYVDTSDWRVTKFDVRLEKRYAERLGLEKSLLKRTVCPVRIHFLKSVGDVVHLKGGIEDLKKSQKKVIPPEPGTKKVPEAKKSTPPPKAPAKPATQRPPARDEPKPRKL
jgi:sporulation protein YlmC with PRC-barrel domain